MEINKKLIETLENMKVATVQDEELKKKIEEKELQIKNLEEKKNVEMHHPKVQKKNPW